MQYSSIICHLLLYEPISSTKGDLQEFDMFIKMSSSEIACSRFPCLVYRSTLKFSIRKFEDITLDILGKFNVYSLPSLYFLSYITREYVMRCSQSTI